MQIYSMHKRLQMLQVIHSGMSHVPMKQLQSPGKLIDLFVFQEDTKARFRSGQPDILGVTYRPTGQPTQSESQR